MKNLFPILGIAVFSMLGLTSCMKNYKCKCAINEPAVLDTSGAEVVHAIETTSTIELRTRSKKGARKQCLADENEYRAILEPTTTVNCYIE